MTDLNKGTRQRNLRQLSGSAAVPSGNTRSVSVANVVGGGWPPAPSTDWIQALGGRIGGWCIENGKLTADGGNVKLNSYVPSISLGAATDYITGTGFWVGKNSAVYKLHLGDPEANHLKWDGSTLTVVGTISATAGAIGGWTIGANSISADGGNVSISSAEPAIKMGLATNYLDGAGVFMGKSAGAFKFHIGDPTGDYVGWSGSTMVAGGNWITGSAVNFLNIPVLNGATWTNNSPSAGYVAWSSFSLTYQGVSYAIVAGNTNNKYIWWNKATSTTVLQSSNTAPSGAIDQFLVCLNSSGTALPALFQNVIYADYIKTTTLAAIQANLGAATISDVLTIGLSGGIYQGSGTFASPTTGLKVWNDGGVGRLATFLSGTPQVYFDTSGKLKAGGGEVTLDGYGITIDGGVGPGNEINWKSGVTTIASIHADDGSVGYNAGGITVYGDATRNQARLDLVAVHNAGPPAGIYISSHPTSPYMDMAGTVNVEEALNVGTATGAGRGDIQASGNCTITGTLTVGGLTVRPSGDARYLARVSSSILNVTGDGTGYAVIFNTEAYDDGNDYNTANGIVTAPVTGRYHFDFSLA